MDILVLQGSPNRDGSTAMLVEEFAPRRARGGACRRAHRRVRGGCEPVPRLRGMRLRRAPVRAARRHDEILAPGACCRHARAGDAVVLLRHDRTAQGGIDRFCSANSAISAKRLKAALITVAWNADGWTFDALVAHYETLCRYLDMTDCGQVARLWLRHARHDARFEGAPRGVRAGASTIRRGTARPLGPPGGNPGGAEKGWQTWRSR